MCGVADSIPQCVCVVAGSITQSVCCHGLSTSVCVFLLQVLYLRVCVVTGSIPVCVCVVAAGFVAQCVCCCRVCL